MSFTILQLNMKTFFGIILLSMTLKAQALNTQLKCEMERPDWSKMSFEFNFKRPNKAEVIFIFARDGMQGQSQLNISNITVSEEARYVGVDFSRAQEKMVFIFPSPIFEEESREKEITVEVVSSIFHSFDIKCRATK